MMPKGQHFSMFFHMQRFVVILGVVKCNNAVIWWHFGSVAYAL